MFLKQCDYYPEGFKREKRDISYTVPELTKLKEEQRICEATAVLCDSERNLTVNLGAIRGIIPRDEGAIGIKEGETREIALVSRVGKPVCFVIEDLLFDGNGKQYALLSRRKAQEICKAEMLKNLRKGDVINAKITHIESFGVFCDIGCGNIALLPIDFISVSRISHPCDRFFTGQNIKAVVSGINDGRITLTHKELLGTWEENVSNFSAGQTVSGVIRSVEDYGVFVELTPNLAGLAEPKENVKVGQKASVYIKSINPEKMKVKLIIIDAFDSEIDTSFSYYFDGERMDSFYYSPYQSSKQIYTEFV